MATLTEVTVVDSVVDLFTARIPQAHAINLMNRTTLRRVPVYDVVDGKWQETDTRLVIEAAAFILYIQEVALL